MLLLSGTFKVLGGAQTLKDWAALGYPAEVLLPIGLTELACAILYAVPRTSILGAVLVTGYLGGAVATHVRVLQGAFAWLGSTCATRRPAPRPRAGLHGPASRWAVWLRTPPHCSSVRPEGGEP